MVEEERFNFKIKWRQISLGLQANKYKRMTTEKVFLNPISSMQNQNVTSSSWYSQVTEFPPECV